MEKEEENKAFSCFVCAKKYTTNGSLKRHLNVHFELEKFYCNTCNKKFTQRESLLRHNLNFHKK